MTAALLGELSRPSGAQDGPRAPVPQVIAEAIDSPASQLDGGDAAGVRIHTGQPAQRAARSLGAKAFTVGNHIVFGRGGYASGTAEGDQLIEHELVHVGQQRAERAARLDLKPDPAASDPFRALDQAIAAASKTPIRGPDLLASLQPLRRLADAIESGDLVGARAAVAAFIAADTRHPLDPATAVLLGDVPMTLVVRSFLAGLTAESAQLEKHFFQARSEAYQQPSRGRGYSNRYEVLHEIVDQVVTGARFGTAADAGHAIDQALKAFTGINDAAASLDLADVLKRKQEARAQAAMAQAEDPFGGLSDLARDRARTPDAFYDSLLGLVPALTEVLQRAFQVLINAAVAELEAAPGRDSPALQLAKQRLQDIGTVVSGLDTALIERAARPGQPVPAVPAERPITTQVDVTRSDFERTPRRHLDEFDRSRSSPSVKISAYDKETLYFAEKSLDVRRILQIRAEQITTLEQLFGLAGTAESKQNAAAMVAAGSFRLDNDDSWRRFLLEKFKSAKKDGADDWTALTATVDVLRSYLKSFTIHTPYNIDEFGDNYLSRTFPRALTGQLIHDCGVYALRIVYALSLLRELLHLRIRTATMPAHVGLIITFGDDLGKGALFANNDDIQPIPSDTLADFARQWQQTDAQGKERATPVRLNTGQFLAEIVASRYAPGVDVPVRLADVPRSPSTASRTANKQALWDFYHQSVIKPLATAPTKDVAQPELLYLDYLKQLRQLHNEVRVPTYAAANDRWTNPRNAARTDALKKAATEINSSDAKKKNDAQQVIDVELAELLTLFGPLRSGLADLRARADEVSTFMRTHPEAVGQGARLTPAARLNLVYDLLTVDNAVDAYLGDGTTTGDLKRGKVDPPPWADQKGLPRRTDE